MSLFAYDRIEEVLDVASQSVASLAFGRIQVLPIDRIGDAVFYNTVLKPITDRYSGDSDYKVAQTTQSKSRSGARGAKCTRVSFVGEHVAQSAPAREAETFDREAELPYAENELDGDQLGVIVLYELPFVATSRSQADDTTEWTALRVEMVAQRDRLLRASCSAVATVFDFPTMRRIVNEAYVIAMRRNVRLPSVLERAANAAFLVAVPPSPFWQSAQNTYRVAQMFHSFIDQYMLQFYAASLDSELLATSAAFSHAATNTFAVAADQLPPNIVNINPQTSSTTYDAFRELGLPLKRRAITTSTDSADAHSVVSVATTTFSLHSRVSLPGGWQYGYERSPFSSTIEESELSDRLRGDPRASAPAAASAGEHIDAGFLVRPAPPARLVWRFTFAMTCAVHLLGEYCGARVDRWRVADFYYLFQLGMLERDVRCRAAVETLSAHPLKLADETRAAIACVIALDGVLDACDGCAELEHIVYGVMYEAADVAALVRPLFEQHQLHSVIESYQTCNKVDRRMRRSRATLVAAHVAPAAELTAFMGEHALLWYVDRISALAADPSSSFDPVTSVLLRFDAEHASPLALLSSMRLHVPSARDGVDFLVVWSPREYPRTDAARPRIYVTMCRWLYRRIALGAAPRALAERRMAGRCEHKQTLVAPCIMRALRDADTNIRIDALGAVQALCASLQWASGAQWTPESRACVLSARAAVDSLRHVARAFRSWGSGADADVNRASAIVSAVTDDRVGVDLKRRTTPYSNIFSALHVALSNTHNFGFMTLEEARRFVKRTAEDDRLRRFIVLQLDANGDRVYTLSRSDAERLTSKDADVSSSLQCSCGASPQNCDRMLRLLEVRRARQRSNTWPDRAVECCLCSIRHMDRSMERRATIDGRLTDLVATTSGANIALLLGRRKPAAPKGKRRRRTMKNYTTATDSDARSVKTLERCSWCYARNVVSASLPRGIFVELFDPTAPTADEHGGGRMTMHQIVAALARTSDCAALSALRVSDRAWRVKDTPLPRDAAQRYKAAGNASVTVVSSRRRYNPIKSRTYERGHESVVQLTRASVLDCPTATATVADEADAPLLDMLIELEMMTLRPHAEVGALLDAKQYEAMAASLLPLDAPTRLKLLTAPDETLIGDVIQFPLCASALVETTSAYGKSRWQVDANCKERDLLANADDVLMRGRTPRPFVGMPPAFAELLMLHYYTPSDSTQ